VLGIMSLIVETPETSKVERMLREVDLLVMKSHAGSSIQQLQY
jgi:hypothetical protein